jgi:hypothetical protein
MDSLLRFTVLQLLNGPTNVAPSLPDPLVSPAALGLRYLRDRVGVPRDMGVHAAKQLRSFLNHVLSLIE